MTQRDSIYAQPRGQVAQFTFDEQVAAVFPDMIRRSVPGYAQVVAMTGVLAGLHAQAHSLCYDLGCSLGASSLAMREQIQAEDCRIVAVDNSAAMLEKAREHLPEGGRVPVELVCADLRDVQVRDASVVVMNYTLQFIPREERAELLARIHAGLLPGGLLILAEKVRFEDPGEEARMVALHHAYKRANGYSELEISQKRSALEEVLLPETEAVHRERLAACGFSRVERWFQCCNFVAFAAYR